MASPEDVVKALREDAEGYARAHRMMTDARYGEHYESLAKEQTTAWKAADLLEQQAERIRELEEALDPFAKIDGEGDQDFPDRTKVTTRFGRTTDYTLTLAAFRRARSTKDKA